MAEIKIAITGATGFVGNVLVEMLLKLYSPEQLVLLVNKNDPYIKNVKKYNIPIIEGDIRNYNDVYKLIQSCTHIIHLAALISYWIMDKKKLEDVNVLGVQNIVNAAISCKIKKLIHISSVGAIGFNKNGQYADEMTIYNWPDSFLYMKTKHEGQIIVEEAIKRKKLNAVIINPAGIMGPGDPNVMTPHNQLYKLVRKGFFFTFSGGVSVVDVRDLSFIIIKALTQETKGNKYLAVGHNVLYKDVVQEIQTNMCKRKFSIIKVPSFFLIIFGAIAEFISLFTRKKPLITISYGSLSGLFPYYSNARSIKEFGINYLPFNKTIRDASIYYKNTFNDKK